MKIVNENIFNKHQEREDAILLEFYEYLAKWYAEELGEKNLRIIENLARRFTDNKKNINM